MNTVVVICGLLAVALGKPVDEGVSLSQDTLGNYKLFYKTLDSTRQEHATQDGNVVGSYTYNDKEGTVHTIKYVASDAGFSAEGDVPLQVTETPEVAAARLAHLQIVEKTRASLPQIPEEEDEVEETIVLVKRPFTTFEKPQQVFRPVELPVSKTVEFLQVPEKTVQIDHTREIEEAKAQHFAAHKLALETLAEEYRRIAK